MRYRITRLLYRFLYWFADRVGAEAGSDIIYGFATKYRRPKDVPDVELYSEIQRLGKAIQGSSGAIGEK